VEDSILPGDVVAGDLIVLPDASDQVLVRAVRLGHGGFILTVSPEHDNTPEAQRLVTLTTSTALRRRGRVQAS
jgi:hypothetical protein